jgi:hypothetical protein
MRKPAPREYKAVAFLRKDDGTPARGLDGLPLYRELTPIWAPPDGKIPPRYREPATDLATSPRFRKSWLADNDSSKFFMVRDRWIASCEAARAHNWRKDRDQFDYRHSLEGRGEDLVKAARNLRDAMEKAPPGSAQKFGFLLCAAVEGRALSDDEVRGLSSTARPLEILKAIEDFAANREASIGIAKRYPFHFGPLEFSELPSALPSPETALAVQLADQFSRWRPDSPNKIEHASRFPDLTAATPWKPLAQFISAALGKPVDPKGLQSRTKNITYAGVLLAGFRRD